MKTKAIVILGMMIFTAGYESGAKVVELEPIVITTSRTERNLSDVPSNTSVITSREISGSSAKCIPDLLKHAEGVYTYDASGTGTTGAVNMRGFYGGMSSHQLVLVDGIPQNKGKDKLIDWDMIALDNVERIEIVRGPASVLYGDNAMSGVINIITRKPENEPETKISASYGTFNTGDYVISTTGAYKKTGYLFELSRKNTEGFRKHSGYARIHIGSNISYAVTDAQKVRLLLDYYIKERGALPWALSETQVERDRRQARPGTENDKSDERKNSVSVTHSWETCNIKTEETFYYKYNSASSFYTSGVSESTTKEQSEDEDTYGLLLKSSLNGEVFGTENFFTAGIDLEKDKFGYEEYNAPYKVRGAVQKDYKAEREKAGPYIQDEIILFDFLRIIGGIRYDWTEFDFDDNRNDSNSKIKNISKITPRCAAVCRYRENSNIYFNYGRAFRTPTLGQMFTYGSLSNPDLNPEEAVNYELGMRHFFNEYLKANISLYWTDIENEIWYDYDPGVRKYRNYGETSHRGIETGLNFAIIKELTGFLNYSYTRAKNENGQYKDKYLPNIPVHKASFGLEAVTKSGFRTNLFILKTGESFIDQENVEKLTGYFTVDAKATYERKQWSCFFAIDNILDKEYNSYGYKSGTTKFFNPAPERTYTIGLDAKF